MNPSHPVFLRIAAALAAVTLLLLLAWPGFAQAPQPELPSPDSPLASPIGGFTYQGKLHSNGQPFSGVCDFQFGLWDAASGGALKSGPATSASVSVANGLFTTLVDLSNTYSEALWLGVAVARPRWHRARPQQPAAAHRR